MDLGGITLIVTGFPRSGTSMMMRMLRLGGVEILYTEQRPEDQVYDPHGVLELKDVDTEIRAHDKEWTANKAVKIVAPYLQAYPVNRPLKFIFMQRPVGEIITSMIAKNDLWSLDVELVISNARGYIEHLKSPVLFVKYHDAMNYPKTTAMRIEDFLGVKLDVENFVKGADHQVRDKIPTKAKAKILKLGATKETMYEDEPPTISPIPLLVVDGEVAEIVR